MPVIFAKTTNSAKTFIREKDRVKRKSREEINPKLKGGKKRHVTVAK